MKTNLPVLKDFLVVLSQDKIIQSFIPNLKEFEDFINKDYRSLFTVKNEESNDFFNKLDHSQVVFNYKVDLKYNDIKYSSFLNGFKNDFYYIIVLFNHESDEEILKRIIMLNSVQVNELRMLKKDILIHDEKAYEEISKLNSELLNKQRIIEKQNQELKNYNNLLKKISTEDTLTGCYNRRYFYDYMRENIMPSQSDEYKFLVLIDFNNFKKINDRFGHDAGDRLLVHFVNETQEIIKDIGEIFRLGGDEFLILLSKCDNHHANQIMDKINKNFSMHSEIASLAYGMVSFKESEISQEFDLTNLLKKADDLMYEDKSKRKKVN